MTIDADTHSVRSACVWCATRDTCRWATLCESTDKAVATGGAAARQTKTARVAGFNHLLSCDAGCAKCPRSTQRQHAERKARAARSREHARARIYTSGFFLPPSFELFAHLKPQRRFICHRVAVIQPLRQMCRTHPHPSFCAYIYTAWQSLYTHKISRLGAHGGREREMGCAL